MTANVGNIDRIVRFVLGVALIAVALLGIVSGPVLYWGAIIVGIVLAGTAAMRFCPLYRILGMSTCKV